MASNKSDATTRLLPGLPPTDTDPRDTEVTDEKYLKLRAAEENQAEALRKAKEDETLRFEKWNKHDEVAMRRLGPAMNKPARNAS
ncbi:hypothetical protein KXW83_007690 [Aspergillus fumigatus]|nr:hypothetical protein KXX10_005859 [Aspergillus fumigatus]KAH1415973.1 hypothetical protein KXX32_000267 [Aspergillus fumigatus]KAH1489225.1 hypothetical protein KXX06_003315 [Aspergillus fumigatus]KAH2378375.1 hypothetical protein KXV41_004969 [Aspergillus fumigatus]KAH2409298.1 hypothetical protein KXW64_000718 [Aspergillus fumigatus]